VAVRVFVTVERNVQAQRYAAWTDYWHEFGARAPLHYRRPRAGKSEWIVAQFSKLLQRVPVFDYRPVTVRLVEWWWWKINHVIAIGAMASAAALPSCCIAISLNFVWNSAAIKSSSS